MKPMSILIVDDDDGIRDDLGEFFSDGGYQVWKAGAPSEAFKILGEQTPDVALLDLKLPEMDGLAVLKIMKADYPDIEVIIITGHGDTRNIVEAMRFGAFDFFTKPFRMVDIRAAIRRTDKYIAMQRRLKKAETGYALISRELRQKLVHPIIGESRAIKTVMELMSKVAETDDTSVLILGESGVGKELVARGIHALSGRREKIFCDVNCSAIPETLFESECFGHVKGSFTGADGDRTGYFEAANGGTIFLDEIGDLPMAHQAKLLKAIENKTVTPLGSSKSIPADVRIISATNHDPDRMVMEGRFRLDLFHRVNTFVIQVPALTERPKDIPILLNHYFSHYLKKFRKPEVDIGPEILDRLMSYRFPGNIRELKNMTERAAILFDGKRLDASHFSLTPGPPPADTGVRNTAECHNLDEVIKQTIVSALEKTHRNKSESARLLGISRQALGRKMEKYGLA